MEYIYAALLLHKAGKPINENSLVGVLKAAGVNADSVRVKALVASLAEVDIDEALKFQPIALPAPAPTGPAPAAEEKPAEEKKEKEEKKEEKALEGLGALFG